MTDRNETRAADILPLRPRRPCPICERPSQRDSYPFCSKRCKDVDLHRWLTGAYAIPAVETDDDGEASGQAFDDEPARDR